MNLFKRIITVGALGFALTLPASGQAQSTDDLAKMQTFLGIMESYFGIIESAHNVGANPEKSAILQMQKIQEVYEERGEKARSIEVLRKVLDESKNQTIRNAAYMLLGDTLKETGRADEAVKLLQQALRENITASQ